MEHYSNCQHKKRIISRSLEKRWETRYLRVGKRARQNCYGTLVYTYADLPIEDGPTIEK